MILFKAWTSCVSRFSLAHPAAHLDTYAARYGRPAFQFHGAASRSRSRWESRGNPFLRRGVNIAAVVRQRDVSAFGGVQLWE
jgi:hypothetical protein